MTIEPAAGSSLRSIDTLILAGGLGTRLRSAVPHLPKVLAPVGRRPFLYHLLMRLSRAGAGRVVLSLGYRADDVLKFLATNTFPGLEIATVVEPEPLGTAGAVRYARPALTTDPVLVLNGDSYIDADWDALLQHHRARIPLGTMLCVTVDDAARYGRADIDAAGWIVGFREKSAAPPERALINAGAYLLSARLLDEVASGSARSLEHDVFEQLPARSLAAFAGASRFVDIGTPESLAYADEIFDANK